MAALILIGMIAVASWSLYIKESEGRGFGASIYDVEGGNTQ